MTAWTSGTYVPINQPFSYLNWGAKTDGWVSGIASFGHTRGTTGWIRILVETRQYTRFAGTPIPRYPSMVESIQGPADDAADVDYRTVAPESGTSELAPSHCSYLTKSQMIETPRIVRVLQFLPGRYSSLLRKLLKVRKSKSCTSTHNHAAFSQLVPRFSITFFCFCTTFLVVVALKGPYL
jgi:hypothetical protein